MATWSTESAPTWAKDAIATDRGWTCPKTGQVLVACKRLDNAVPYYSKFEKGGVPKYKQRGGARPGAGRKSDAERQRIKDEHIIAAAEFEAYEIEASRLADQINDAEIEAYEVESSSEINTEVEGDNTEIESSSEIDTEVESSSEIDTEVESSSEIDTEIESSSEIDTEIESSSEIDTEVEIDVIPEPLPPKAKPRAKAKAKPRAKAKAAK